MTRPPIVVTLDGSDKDGRAIAVGKALARLAESPLHFVRVVSDPPTDVTGRPVAPGLSEAAAIRHAGARAELAAVEAAHSGGPEARATSALLNARDVADALIEHAVDQNALLVVMATRAPGVASRAIVGSVSDRVMRDSRRPVVLVPPGAGFLAGKRPAITRVLVPLDDSSLSLRSLEFIIRLPHARDLEYVLLEVISDVIGGPEAEMRLQTAAAWLRSQGVRAVEPVISQGMNTAEAILTSVREVLPDAIVMSTRGAGGVGRLTFGSVAEGVVRASELPVMLLTPRVLAAET